LPPGRCSFQGKDQKRGLKHVLSVSPVVQNPAADREHHWTMPSHQDRKCVLIAARREALQELSVGKILSVGRRGQSLAELAKSCAQIPGGHGSVLSADGDSPLMMAAETEGLPTISANSPCAFAHGPLCRRHGAWPVAEALFGPGGAEEQLWVSLTAETSILQLQARRFG
jgi:hypothetical protein